MEVKRLLVQAEQKAQKLDLPLYDEQLEQLLIVEISTWATLFIVITPCIELHRHLVSLQQPVNFILHQSDHLNDFLI